MIATCTQHISCQSEVLFKKIEQKYKANIPPNKYDISGISLYFILAVLIDKTSDCPLAKQDNGSARNPWSLGVWR